MEEINKFINQQKRTEKKKDKIHSVLLLNNSLVNPKWCFNYSYNISNALVNVMYSIST